MSGSLGRAPFVRGSHGNVVRPTVKSLVVEIRKAVKKMY